uniref:Uncharacterized protein n=1 Tax=Octopus bimaculoides TaxID=37653 RepID=A0A0L8HYY7_OCTBM
MVSILSIQLSLLLFYHNKYNNIEQKSFFKILAREATIYYCSDTVRNYYCYF